MDTQLLAGLAAFAFVSSITPGPNNLMLMASGANFGLQRTVPHMLGVALGFVLMVVLVGLGLVGLFDRVPVLHVVLKIVSVVYLLYLAWKIAHAAPPAALREPGSAAPAGRPFSFLQAAAFQWVNPKAWAMALTAVTVYTVARGPLEIVVVACVFGAINLPSVACWAVLGQAMRRVLNDARRLRAFNVTMALLLVVSLYPVLQNQV